MKTKSVNKEYDVVVVGGGLSGVCAAIASARNGAKTALIQDRPVLGGNASSEVRVNVNGAARGGGFKNAVETGILMEILLATKKVNPQNSYHMFDHVLWEKTTYQENLDLYLNTTLTESNTENDKIISIHAVQFSSQTEFVFTSKLFVDTTGDATLAFLSNADFTIGRESRSTYNESLAPIKGDNTTMGSSLLFLAKDMGKPTPFELPSWAYKLTKEDIGSRDMRFFDYGYWWIEVGGDDLATIENSEEIRNELLKYLYGVFDYIKNSGNFEAENLALDWVGSVPGRRESRRVYGDYVLNQNDIDAKTRFVDAVAYGGWTMDDHTVGGIRAEKSGNEIGTVFHAVDDIYTIPYRCIYSRNIENLFVGGRAISASHMALSSTRVMGTCSVIGQAIGTAAAIAVKNDISPREVGKSYIRELQQQLIRDDCYIPGIVNDDKEDLVANNSTVTCSSQQIGCEANKINSSYARKVEDEQNGWISEKISKQGEWVQFSFDFPVSASTMKLVFDPNTNKILIPSLKPNFQNELPPEMPYELVRDYKVEFVLNGDIVKVINVKDNFQRVNCHSLENISFDSVKLTVLSNYGDDYARVFEVRLYQ